MKLLNNKGSIIIQALISIAIFSAVSASIIRLLQMQNNLSAKTTEQFEMIYFVDEVRNILSDPNACKETFTSKNARRDMSATSINQVIEDEFGEVYSFEMFSKGSIIKRSEFWTLTLSNLYLQSDDQESSIDFGTTFLHLEVEFKDLRNNRTHLLKRRVKIFASIDNAEKIQTCYANRGIGLGKDISKKTSPWNRTPDTKGHYINQRNLSIKTQKNSASINIGGSFRVGALDSSCLKEIVGAIRYNPNSDKLEVCSERNYIWRELNEPIAFQERTYALRATLPIKLATTPRPFKYCSITYKNYDTGTCSLERLEDGKWRLTHESSKSNFGSCEATCYQ
ncbi:hypothetical protein [Halobacteriovorax marinus]|uniref:hypothetical protein n=1 Tax=Halobacteriovorax marinus TaxID=97084 RepID=UPI003A948C54